MSLYESGDRKPDYPTLVKIADYFSVSVDYLLGRTDALKTQKILTTNDQETNLTADKEFKAFTNDPELERWYKELPKNKEDDLQSLKQMWEII